MADILDGLTLDTDGIYSGVLPPLTDQADEVRERTAVAERAGANLLREIADHHSIPVMDREVRLFLRGVSTGGVVADVGGGWAWHWRRVKAERPDVYVVVVDFVRDNLKHALRLLGDLVNDRVFLVHGDATRLPFPSSVFNGYWSVQALQHVPNFEQAVREAYRVLQPSGRFACYSLNRAWLIESAYRLLRRRYHVRGKRPDGFHLARGSAAEADVIRRVFGFRVTSRYTEILFHPDCGLYSGGAASWIGQADARLSTRHPLFACIARQRSYHTRKPS